MMDFDLGPAFIVFAIVGVITGALLMGAVIGLVMWIGWQAIWFVGGAALLVVSFLVGMGVKS